MARKLDRRGAAAFRTRLVGALSEAEAVLSDGAIGVGPRLEFRPVAAALDEAVTQIAAELAGTKVRPARVREFGALLGELDAVRRELHEQRTRTYAQIEKELESLRNVSNLEDLFEKTPAALTRSCGLDEAGLWSIEKGQMKLVKLYCVDDARRAAAIATELSPIPLHAQLLEIEVMRRRSGILVVNSSADSRVNADAQGLFGTDAHAIVPIMPEGKVIGFFHGGCYPSNRLVDAFDFDALSTFARGFGGVLERVVLRGRVDRQRDYFQRMVASGSELADRLANAEVSLSSPGGASEPGGAAFEGEVPPQLPPESRIRSLLTRRELEVLELMAAGRTNGEIAQELVVSVGTVKFHVRRILGKLNATNRAQAVSRYMRIAAAQRTVS